MRLIVEFPPGALILLPSATISHSNVPLPTGQKRASITQYTGGSLFRFVDNGFETDVELRDRGPKKFEVLFKDRKNRWKRGLEKWSTFENDAVI